MLLEKTPNQINLPLKKNYGLRRLRSGQRDTKIQQESTGTVTDGEETCGRGKKSARGERRTSAPSRRGEPKRRPGKLTITEALEEQEERQRSVAQYKRKLERERQKSQQFELKVKQLFARYRTRNYYGSGASKSYGNPGR